jgi:hypothetical protein
VNLAVLGLWWFSLFNTAVYFHTLLEKVSGLIAGLIGWYLAEVITTLALDAAGLQNDKEI